MLVRVDREDDIVTDYTTVYLAAIHNSGHTFRQCIKHVSIRLRADTSGFL